MPEVPERISRWSEEPYYLQLAAIIAGQIERGELKPGEALPTEPQLMGAYGVARGTVRRALRVLREWGYIETIYKRGSRVRPRGDWGPPQG